jgi:hypothetical protein
MSTSERVREREGGREGGREEWIERGRLFIFPLLPSCRDEDDLYTAYAVIHSKPTTYLLTNDYQGCVRRHLPDDDVLVVFEQWLRVRRAHVTNFRKNRKYKIQVFTKK